MIVPAFVLRPVVKLGCVATSVIGLRDAIPEAGVRGAIGWCAAEFLIETVSAWAKLERKP